MTAEATVRHFRTVAKTETVGVVRRYYQRGCPGVRTPPEFGPLAIGVPRDSRLMTCRCLFSRFRGPKTLRRVSVRLASKRPKKGRFWPSLCLRDKAVSMDKSTRHEKIHKISTSHKTRKSAQMLAFLKISTKSTKSTAIFGCRGCVVFMRANAREWPSFRVFGGQRRPRL